MQNESPLLCNEKPNCVSTQEARPDFHIPPFELVSKEISVSQIIHVALSLPRATLTKESPTSAHIEYTSRVFRFVDDLELEIKETNLSLRFRSRVGYSDFGVNRKRAEKLRGLLKEKGLIK